MRIEFYLMLQTFEWVASGLIRVEAIPQHAELIFQLIRFPIPNNASVPSRDALTFRILGVAEIYESSGDIPEIQCIVELVDNLDVDEALVLDPVIAYSLSLPAMIFPPLVIDDARKFAACSSYKGWEVCVYAGGGSQKQHDMYWAWIIYSKEGNRQDFGRFPAEEVLDLDDGFRSCYQLIDFWEKPIDYEEISNWRTICDFLWESRGNRAYILPVPIKNFEDCDRRLLSFQGRPRRQLLWDLYFIQLIKWSDSGWCLKGGWEYKIDFLEKVYILGRDPDSLSKPWLEKWANLLDANLEAK